MRAADVPSRAVAAAFVLLAVADVALLVRAWGEPALRTVARGVGALVLLELGAMAWRAPRKRPERFRRRLRELLEVLSRPELHEAHAESSPQVGLAAAMLDDWCAIERERRRLEPTTLSHEEITALDDFARVVSHLKPSLERLAEAPVPQLEQEEPWRLLVAAATRAREALPTP